MECRINHCDSELESPAVQRCSGDGATEVERQFRGKCPARQEPDVRRCPTRGRQRLRIRHTNCSGRQNRRRCDLERLGLAYKDRGRQQSSQEKAEPPRRVPAINNAHGPEPTYREIACWRAQLRSGPRPKGTPPVSALLGIRNRIREAKGLCESMTVIRAMVVRQRPEFRP